MRIGQNLTFEAPTEQDFRTRRINRVISKAFSGLPDHVIELNALLRCPSVDVRLASRIIRNDPALHVRILSLANAAVTGGQQPVQAIPEAMVLLGAERLRAIILSYEFTNHASQRLSERALQEFWRHSALAAMYSERIAQGFDYPEPEEAYVGGLLHDIGSIPLMIIAQEERAIGVGLPANWQDDVHREREFFGLDHCEVGRRIGVAWDFSALQVEVIENHHAPLNSAKDSVLVGIVAAGDYYASLPSAATASYRPEVPSRSVPQISGKPRPQKPPLVS